jgi:hypothetical protein
LSGQVRETVSFLHGFKFIRKLSERLSDVTARYPKIDELLQKAIHDAQLSKIKPRKFKDLKERLIIIDVLLTEREDFDQSTQSELIDLILNGDFQGVDDILHRSHEPKQKRVGWVTTFIRYMFGDESSSPDQEIVSRARHTAARMPDADFLLRLKGISTYGTLVQKTIADAQNIAEDYFDTTISKLLRKIWDPALRIRQAEGAKTIQRTVSIAEEQDTNRYLTDFMRQIEERSQSESTT